MYAIKAVLLCSIYTVAGRLGLLLASFHPSASPVWPPTGIALASLLLLGPRYAPAIFLGAFFVNVTTSGSIPTSLFIAFGNTLEGLVGAMLIRRYARGVRSFDTANSVLWFVACVVVASVISASVGVATLLAGGLSLQYAVPVWFTWLLGDVVGGVTITPLILLWFRERSSLLPVRRERLPELFALSLLTFVVAFAVFGNPFSTLIVHYPLAYLSFLPILWAAVRFGPRQTMTVTFVVSCIATVATLRGSGPYAVGSTNASLLFLQAFIGVASLVSLTLAGALRERRASTESLERKVAERTSELAVARQQDQANLQRLCDMINHMTIATVATDEHRTVLQANDEFCRFFCPDRTPKDLIGQKLSVCLQHRVGMPMYAQLLMRLLSENDRVLGYELQLPQNSTTLSCDYIPIQDRGLSRGHLLLCRDISEEKRTDRVKSEFVSLASHQLRTPLTKIRWSLGRLEKLAIPSDGHRELLDVTKSAAEVMADTINVMLTISQMEAGKMEPRSTNINLYMFFDKIRHESSDELRDRGQTLRCECSGDLVLSTDQLLLREIVLNLVRNAMKYTPRGGHITLRATCDDRQLCLEISDTGIGISEKEKHKIFQKFFRAENALAVDQSGIGLGLYLVQMAADLLRARVSFDSEIGKGTTFRLSFPPPLVSQLTDLPVAPSVSQLSLGLEVGATRK